MRPFQTDTSEELVLANLPVGTRFYVENGCWEGQIVLIDGKKGVSHAHGERAFREDDYEETHEVTILKDKEEGDIVEDDTIPY